MAANAEKLVTLLKQGKGERFPLIFIIPGSGQIARYAVEGGAHFVMALNAGLYRLAGIGSLGAFMPFGNANDQTEDLLRRHILPRVRTVPIVAGLMANDPAQPLAGRLKRMQDLGVAGITNWPFVGMFDGKFRQFLSREGMSTDAEILMLQAAAEMGFVTFGYCASPEDAEKMAKAEIDALVLNVGLTHEIPDIRQKRDRIQFQLAKLNQMIAAVDATGADPVLFFLGGSITRPEDTAELYRWTRVHGYGGGSSFERIPVRQLVTNTVKQFCSVPRLPEMPAPGEESSEIIGKSPAIVKLKRLIRRIGPYDVNVLIEGDSGVGKELVANRLHALSQRASQPFITLNCGAIPDTLVESEFFGHEKGAFTGAVNRRLGKFELASGGTLFLDEVAELSPKAQVSLLRAIQEKEITRVGGEVAIPVDVRIIAATHQDLEDLVRRRSFRPDLFYRLNTVSLKIPPLRSHPQDIPLLVDVVLEELSRQYDKQVIGVTLEFMSRLMKNPWPGNVRELRHVLCRAVLLEDGPVLQGTGLDLEDALSGEEAVANGIAPLGREALRQSQDRTLLEALDMAGGNKSRAARMLGISRKTVYARLKRIRQGHVSAESAETSGAHS